MSDSRFDSRGPTSPDPLGVRLAGLRAETDRLFAPSARSVRRRGNRRSAIQVASTTLAAASAIGLGAVVLPVVGGTDNDPIGPSITSTTTPVVVPTLTEDVLLSANDLAAATAFADFHLDWVVDATHADPGLALSTVCLPRLATPDATQSLAREFGTGLSSADAPLGTPLSAAEVIMVQPDDATADETSVALRDWLLSCGRVDDGTRLAAAWTLDGAGDDGFAVEVLAPIPGTDGGLAHQVAIGRSGSVVVGVLLTTDATEGPVPERVFALLQDAMARTCAQSGTTCPADVITGERATSQPSATTPPDDPLLSLDDLPTWNGVLRWDTAFDVDDVSSGRYGVSCNGLWRDLGATNETQRSFSVVTGTEPGDEPSATEVVADFPDEATAAAALESMRAGLDGCGSGGEIAAGSTIDDVGGLRADGGGAWLLTLPVSGSTPQRVLIGTVRSGARTALVTVQYARADVLPPEPLHTHR
jgi:hypothetical protein